MKSFDNLNILGSENLIIKNKNQVATQKINELELCDNKRANDQQITHNSKSNFFRVIRINSILEKKKLEIS